MTRDCCGDDCCSSPADERTGHESTVASLVATASRVPTDEPTAIPADDVREQVRAGYAAIAQGGAAPSEAGCCAPTASGGGCCGSSTAAPADLARAIGYSEDELAGTPDSANMGLSCGNPTAIASLREGEVVLDLGSGGGFDCFIAGPKVGRTGRVIGVDMTAEMVSKARKNIADYRQRTGLDNVEFRLGEIEALPVADASVDVVISNCVLNLSPDKPRVWKEIARVLKPGGRVAVSDLALMKPLPDSVKRDVEALVGCVAGAVLVDDTRSMIAEARLTSVELKAKPEYVDAMTHWEDPLYQRIVEKLPAGSKTSDYITSLDVSARKPAW
jgi:arsenite methyltransferase